MALTLIAETGSNVPNANSYATVANGTTYHDSQLTANRSTWTSAGATKQAEALVMATRLIDDNVLWAGNAVYIDQILGWPRSGAIGKHGWILDNDAVPQDVIDATCELARWLLEEDRTKDDDTLGFKRMKVANLELEVNQHDRKKVIPSVVMNMLSPLAKRKGGKIKLARA